MGFPAPITNPEIKYTQVTAIIVMMFNLICLASVLQHIFDPLLEVSSLKCVIELKRAVS